MLGMIHGDAGESTFWAMAKYGQASGDDALCRHIILATLGEADNTMEMTLTNLQNNCSTTERRQIGVHCQTVVRVVDTLNDVCGEDCTINQVVAKCKCAIELSFSLSLGAPRSTHFAFISWQGDLKRLIPISAS